MRRFAVIVLLGAMGLGVAGCSPDIEAINDKPDKYVGRTVEITGVVRRVVTPLSHPGTVLYQITDSDSGDEATLIWVIRADEPPPNEGVRMTMRGVIQAERMFGNAKYAPVIIEESADEERPREGPVSFG